MYSRSILRFSYLQPLVAKVRNGDATVGLEHGLA